MTLVNRLTGDWARQAFVVVQLSHLRMPRRPFSEILVLSDDLLHSAGHGGEGVVFLSPHGVERGSSAPGS